MPKYKTLKALQKAYQTGEIPKDCPLMLDNDYAGVYVGDKKVFYSDEPPSAAILEEALKLLGIPFENV